MHPMSRFVAKEAKQKALVEAARKAEEERNQRVKVAIEKAKATFEKFHPKENDPRFMRATENDPRHQLVQLLLEELYDKPFEDCVAILIRSHLGGETLANFVF